MQRNANYRQRHLHASSSRVKGSEKSNTSTLGVWTLVGIGMGGIIGAGYFLGSGLAVREAGPAVVISFLLGGLIMGQVLGSMTAMSSVHPVRGSFRVYVEENMGSFFGFVLGWIVWTSGILATGSEAIAMATFARLWLPGWPVWAMSLTFCVLVAGIHAIGVRSFGRSESIMSAIKILALAGFILLLALVLTGVLRTAPAARSEVNPFAVHWFAAGVGGILQSMLIVIFTYSGISAIAMASTEAKDPKRSIPVAANWTTVGVVLLYTLAMLGLVLVVPWTDVGTHMSPFVQALIQVGMPLAGDILNAVILVAGFSVMTGAFFSTMRIMESLAQSKMAPNRLGRVGRRGYAPWSWASCALGIGVVVGLSYLLPSTLYNYLTAASSYFALFNWVVNLITFLIWHKRQRQDGQVTPVPWIAFGAPVSSWITAAAIVALGIAGLFVPDFRMGAAASALIFLLVIIGFAFWRRTHHGKEAVPRT